jgi:hypothetical protein
MNEIILREPMFGPRQRDQALPATNIAAATSAPAKRFERKRASALAPS